MNKNLDFNFCKHQKDIEAGFVESIIPEKNVQVEQSETDQLLRMIYQQGADGFPVGDLAWFVGNKANPEVQSFILKNLMGDVSSAANPAIAGLSDEQITLLTRQSGESMQQYTSRLNDSIQKDKFIIQSAKQSVSADKDKDKATE